MEINNITYLLHFICLPILFGTAICILHKRTCSLLEQIEILTEQVRLLRE